MFDYTFNPSALPTLYADTPTPLDAATVAEAIGWAPARVARLLGPFTVAHVTVTEDTDAEGEVGALNDRFTGGVFIVSAEIAHPHGGTVADAVGGAYGGDGVKRVAVELLADLMESIRADVSASA